MKCFSTAVRRSRVIALLCVFVLSAGVGRADWIVEGEIQRDIGDGEIAKQPIVFKIREKAVRMDVGPDLSVITNTQTGEQITLFHAIKGFEKSSRSRSEPEHNHPATTTTAAELPKAAATGRKDKINGYDVEEYVAATPERKQSFWVTKSTQSLDALRAALMSSSATAGGRPTIDDKSLPGFPIRITLEVAAQTSKLPDGHTVEIPASKRTTTIMAVKETKLDDSVLQPPSDYKAVSSTSDRKAPAD